MPYASGANVSDFPPELIGKLEEKRRKREQQETEDERRRKKRVEDAVKRWKEEIERKK